MDEEPANIGVSTLADPEQGRFASGGVLSRNQTEPGGEIPRSRNCRASPTAATSAVAAIGPIPGIVMSRRAVSCFAASTSTCRETAASLISTT